jgi:hypothetical protein
MLAEGRLRVLYCPRTPFSLIETMRLDHPPLVLLLSWLSHLLWPVQGAGNARFVDVMTVDGAITPITERRIRTRSITPKKTGQGARHRDRTPRRPEARCAAS